MRYIESLNFKNLKNKITHAKTLVKILYVFYSGLLIIISTCDLYAYKYLLTYSLADGFPFVCGGANVDSVVGCYSFYPRQGILQGNWTEIGPTAQRPKIVPRDSGNMP